MLETVAWVVFLILFGAVAIVAVLVAVLMLSEDR